MTTDERGDIATADAVAQGAVAVVDVGSGNVGSILNMFRRCGIPVTLASEVADVRRARRLVLPGVGAFDSVVKNLRSSGLVEVLEERVLDDRIPLLGICVGLQLLGRGSEEGDLPGLGWIDGEVCRLPSSHEGDSLRIPHMGWSRTRLSKVPQALPSLETHNRFYFVHSYAMRCDHPTDVLATATYGAPFVAAIEVDNISAVQFHPERSHRHGLALLRDFAASGEV